MFNIFYGSSKHHGKANTFILSSYFLIVAHILGSDSTTPVRICEAPKIPTSSRCPVSQNVNSSISTSVSTSSFTLTPATTATTTVTTEFPIPTTLLTINRIKSTLTSKLASIILTSTTPRRSSTSASTTSSTTVRTVTTTENPSSFISPTPNPNINDNYFRNRIVNQKQGEVNNNIFVRRDNLVKQLNRKPDSNGGDYFCTLDDELYALGTSPVCEKSEWRIRDNKAALSIQYNGNSPRRMKRDVVGQRVPLTSDERAQLERLYGPKFNLEAAETVKAMRQSIPARTTNYQNRERRQRRQQPYGYYNPRLRENIQFEGQGNRQRQKWQRQGQRQPNLVRFQEDLQIPRVSEEEFYKNENKNRPLLNQRNQRFQNSYQYQQARRRRSRPMRDNTLLGGSKQPSVQQQQQPEPVKSSSPQSESDLAVNKQVENESNLDPNLQKRTNLIKMLVEELKSNTKNDQEQEDPANLDEEDECSLYGTWLSPMAGVAIDLQPVGENIMVRLEDLPGGEQNKLLSSSWIGTVMISPVSPTTITLLFQERQSQSSGEVTPSTAVFIGQCVYCKGGTAMQGTWVIFAGSRTCIQPESAVTGNTNNSSSSTTFASVENLNPSATERMYRRF